MTYIYIALFSLLIGGGLVMGQRTSFLQLRPIKLMRSAKKANKQDVHSLWLSLGGIMGAGNIAGVAVALELGGAGSVFWMCVSALVCSSLKYGEIFYGVMYTGIQNEASKVTLGALNYIHRMPKMPIVMGGVFCVLCAMSAFTTGGMIQANAVRDMLYKNNTVLVIGAVLFTLVSVCVSLAAKDGAMKFCTAVVPVMTIIYLFMCVVIISINASRLPKVLCEIVTSAVGFEKGVNGMVWGGFSGIIMSMRRGFSIGLLSHEAGLGTAAIAHAQGGKEQKNPRACASLGIIEVYVDTLIGGLFTALCLLVTQKSSAYLAFESVFGVYGRILVMVTLVFFALSSCVTWFYYGKCALNALNKQCIPVYVTLYGTLVFFAFFIKAPWVYMLSDMTNAAMAGINVVSLLWVSHAYKTVYSIDSASLSEVSSRNSQSFG